jgi:hypothetical protein
MVMLKFLIPRNILKPKLSGFFAKRLAEILMHKDSQKPLACLLTHWFKAIIFSILNLKKDGKICNIPLYAVHTFPEIMNDYDK